MIRDKVRDLRTNMTEVERRLWLQLRSRRFAGFKFRRQRPIGPYIVDFVCLERALIIELDGSQHVESEHDEQRTQYLNEQGYSVLRFWNTDILRHPFGVAEQVLAALASHPSPGDRFAAATLSPEGRGTKGASAATTRERSRRLAGGVARLKDQD